MIQQKHWLSKLQRLSAAGIASVHPFLRPPLYCINPFPGTKGHNSILPSHLRGSSGVVVVWRFQSSPQFVLCRKPEWWLLMNYDFCCAWVSFVPKGPWCQQGPKMQKSKWVCKMSSANIWIKACWDIGMIGFFGKTSNCFGRGLWKVWELSFLGGVCWGTKDKVEF